MKSDKFVIIGGDNRCVYMEEYLNLQGISTVVYETDTQAALDELKKEAVTAILPLPASRDGVNINIKLHCNKLSFESLAALLKKGDRVFGGKLSDTAIELFLDKGIEVIDYYDEELILKNAYLTVLGLEYVFLENNIDLNHGEVLVTGFGRTAKEIARYLSDRNVDFTVSARSDEAISLAKSMNYKTVKLDSFTEKLAKFSLIINTIPANIFDEKALKAINQNALIIDIASYPYGVDDKLSEQYSIKLIRALSLPGKYVPALAGNAIGERIKCLL